VENLVKKKYGMDKKQFVVEIANEMFNLQSSLFIHKQFLLLKKQISIMQSTG
jgi:hypothetical protein